MAMFAPPSPPPPFPTPLLYKIVALPITTNSCTLFRQYLAFPSGSTWQGSSEHGRDAAVGFDGMCTIVDNVHCQRPRWSTVER